MSENDDYQRACGRRETPLQGTDFFGSLPLVTDLLDNQQYPASDLLAVYLTRWGIERVFQQITEVFELRHLIGCTPEATIFQAAFCLVIYNLLQVIRAYVAASQVEMPVDAVSVEQIFVDVQKELTALTVLFPSPTIADWFAREMSRENRVPADPAGWGVDSCAIARRSTRSRGRR